MRKIWSAIGATVGGLILLFSYRTSTAGTGAKASSNQSSTSLDDNTGTSVVTGDTLGSSGQTTTTSGSSSSGVRSVTGQSIPTRYGDVQVRLTINGTRITDVKTLRYPDSHNRSVQINDFALPLLRDQVLSTQSSSIDGVSGATVTTEGYISSVQSAIDSAHLGG